MRRGETDAADCVGNLIGPQTFRAKDAPTYAPALATIVACNVAVLVIMVVIRVVYARRNAQLDETAQPEEDMTDRSAGWATLSTQANAQDQQGFPVHYVRGSASVSSLVLLQVFVARF